MNWAKQKRLKGPKIRYPYDIGFEIARFATKAVHVFRKCKRYGIPANTTEEQWEQELEFMEWALREVADDFPHNPYNLAWDEYWRTKENKPEYDAYRDDVDKYNQKIDKGLHLFASRLCDLWD